MSRAAAAVALCLAWAATGCTESPDVVAVALEGGGAGAGAGDSEGGDGDAGDGLDLAPPFDCEDQALAAQRIPNDVLVIAVQCSLPLSAVQPGEDERLGAITSLLNSTERFDPGPILEPGSDPEGCQSRGLWWIEGERIHLCEPLCDVLNDWLRLSLTLACPE